MNFGGLGSAESISASLSIGSVSESLVVRTYTSEGKFGTVSVQFPSNVRAAGNAMVTIFHSLSGSSRGATFAFTYLFPAPVIEPSLVCTNGKSSGSITLYAAFPSTIGDDNVQLYVNNVRAHILSVNHLVLASSVKIALVFPSVLTVGSVPVEVLISPQDSNSSTFRSSVRYFPPPTVQSVSVTEISTLNRVLIPVQVILKDFPAVGNSLFSVTAPPFTVLVDSQFSRSHFGRSRKQHCPSRKNSKWRRFSATSTQRRPVGRCSSRFSIQRIGIFGQ
jgi:hypothetical protein